MEEKISDVSNIILFENKPYLFFIKGLKPNVNLSVWLLFLAKKFHINPWIVYQKELIPYHMIMKETNNRIEVY